MSNVWRPVAGTELRSRAELALVHPADVTNDTRPMAELLHELRVHQVELEMQNEALRQAQNIIEESRDRYVDLYEFAPVGYLTLSRSAQILALNLTCADLLGEDRKRLLTRRFSQLVAAADIDRWQQVFVRAFQRDGAQTCELGLLRSDGSRFDASLVCARGGEAGAGTQSLRIALSDISARKQIEDERRIAAIAFESQEGMFVTDAQGVILRVNRAFTQLTGYEADEAIGRTQAQLASGYHDKAFYERMGRELSDSGYWQGRLWNRRKDRRSYAVWLTMSAVRGADGAITHYVGAFSEITQHLEAEAEIHRLAHFDPLTHLPNRRLLADRLGQALAGSARSGNFGAVLCLDIDHFKKLNDARGHEVGDQLLIETARRLQASVREDDSVGRLGGDEFVVILQNLSAEFHEAATQCRQVGDKIRAALARPYTLQGQDFHSTVSIGVALFDKHEGALETLLRQADLAMYKAKSLGRDTLCFFDPTMQVALDQRSLLEADLRRALEQQQLVLHYQPQMDRGGRVAGAEALLRWNHPERGLVAPDEFIPLAEETGLILPIGLWVLNQACAQIKAWSASPLTRELRLAVNISLHQFCQSGFVAQVGEALARSGAEPRRLEIEFTESLMIDNVDDTVARMEALRALGVGFSIDDFGTGFSSLAYLRRLPLDQLKIDRMFVHDLARDGDGAAIVQSIITMGKNLGMEVIAEGVETVEQFERLCECHCLGFQGFLFARPMPLGEFEAFVELCAQQAGTV